MSFFLRNGRKYFILVSACLLLATGCFDFGAISPLGSGDGAVRASQAVSTDQAASPVTLPGPTASPTSTSTTTSPSSSTPPLNIVVDPTEATVARQDAIEKVLATYVEAINGRQPEIAHALFTPDLQQRVSRDRLVEGTATSFISRLSVAKVDFVGRDQASVLASFDTVQDPSQGREGQTCSIWEIEYTMVDYGGGQTVGGDWRIDQAVPLDGSPFPCPDVTASPNPEPPTSPPTTASPSTPTEPGAKPVIHLTLDDGPGPETERFLDLFARYGVKATFFVNSNRIPGRTDVINRIVNEGHAVANHTHTHCNLGDPSNLTPSALCGGRTARAEIEDTQRLIAETTGKTPACFRPPYGAQSAATKALVSEYGLTTWLWDIDTNDWRFNAANADYSEDNALAELNSAGTRKPSFGSEGVIVLLHDGTASAPRMLALLETWLADNADSYQFKAIAGC